MKKSVVFVMMCMVLHGVYGDTVRDWMSFYNAINHLQNDLLEAKEIFVLLSDAKQMEWGMGMGQGPDDPDRSQIVVLDLLASRLLDEEGKYTEIVQRSVNQETQQWIDWLSVPPTDHKGVLKMLGNPSPPVRWLGLRKTSFMGKLPDTIVSKLENMVRGDDYVRIVGFSIPSEPEKPPVLGEPINDFRCPLRDEAALILQKHGREGVSVDNHQVALRGLSYLNGLLKSGKDHRSIQNALRRLEYSGSRPAPERFGENLWKEMNSHRDKHPKFSALFKAWDAK